MKTIPLPFSRVSWTVICLLFVARLPSHGQTLHQVLNNGPRASRFNVVVFSEGYTSAQLTSNFPADAQRLLDALFNTEPYKGYKRFFNAYTIAVASNQSGSDHPATGVLRDTYFNSSFETFGVDRLLTIPPNDRDSSYADGQGKVDALLASLLPDYDLALMIVNDPVYGGSGGPVAISSLNTSAPEILIHESGHTIAGLGDEYDAANPGYPEVEEPNTTRQTNRSLIKWHRLISSSTPIPTPETSAYNAVVGLFEGAHYHTTGWYRPKLDCMMNHLGVPFCPVCSAEMILNFLPAPTTDVNLDHRPDLVLVNTQGRSALWYLYNNELTGSAFGPSIPGGYTIATVRDFNGDSRPDYLLFNSSTRQTAVWYLNGTGISSSRFGPTLPAGWTLLGAADFNLNGTLDYLLYQPSTRKTAIWYLNSNLALTSTASGPVLASGYSLVGIDDFNLDGKADFFLFNSSTRNTAIWYLNNNALVSGVSAPSIPAGWTLPALADFDRNGRPDLLLYSTSTRKTAIWYLNNNAFVSSVFGPTLAAGYTIVAPK